MATPKAKVSLSPFSALRFRCAP